MIRQYIYIFSYSRFVSFRLDFFFFFAEVVVVGIVIMLCQCDSSYTYRSIENPPGV